METESSLWLVAQGWAKIGVRVMLKSMGLLLLGVMKMI